MKHLYATLYDIHPLPVLFTHPSPTQLYTLSLHDALPISVLTTLSFELPLMSGTMVLPHQPRPQTATPSFSTSVHRGVRFAHHARPAPGFGGNELRKCGRALAGNDLGAAVLEPFGHLGGPHRGLDCGKKPFHYVSRSAGRHEHALPRPGDEVGIEIGRAHV